MLEVTCTSWLAPLLLLTICWTGACAQSASTQAVAEDTFVEHVSISRLSDTHVQLSLRFQQTHTLSPGNPPTTFPLAVYLLAAATPLYHLQLHLTRGRWDYQSWGASHASHASQDDSAQPPGSAVSVVWRPPTLATHALHWTRLQHRLSGLLCASLNLAAQPHAAPPQHMACITQPTAARSKLEANSSAACMTRHMAWLPREAICTENLTPWLQLLPCRGLAGLAGLLADRQVVLGGEYHSMSLEVEVIPGLGIPNNTAGSSKQQPAQLVLTQQFTAVLRAKTSSTHQAISLSQLLPAVKSLTPCSAAANSTYAVYPQVDSNTTPGANQATAASGKSATVPSRVSRPLTACPSCALQDVVIPAAHAARPPAALLQAALHGAGLHTGTLVIVIQQLDAARIAPAHQWPNHLRPWPSAHGHQRDSLQSVSPQMAVGLTGARVQGQEGRYNTTWLESDSWGVVCLQQWVPWVLRVWLHTLQLHINGQVVPNQKQQMLVWQAVSPAQDRGRPLLLSTCLRLPPDVQQVSLSTAISRAFLTLAEHPPDAHRGWDVPPPILTYLEAEPTSAGKPGRGTAEPGNPNTNGQQASVQAHVQQVIGPGLLVRLPTADVAMPYNVICLTSTVLAVFLGATLNTLLRRPIKASGLIAEPYLPTPAGNAKQ